MWHWSRPAAAEPGGLVPGSCPLSDLLGFLHLKFAFSNISFKFSFLTYNFPLHLMCIPVKEGFQGIFACQNQRVITLAKSKGLTSLNVILSISFLGKNVG